MALLFRNAIYAFLTSLLFLKALASGSSADKSLAAVLSQNDTTPICQQVHQIAKADQCQFAKDYCQTDNAGLFSYIPAYYCFKSSWESNFLFTASVALLIALFTTLGLTASDFLCPNLNTISKLLRMSENVTGVTLLAFGNGSPDLFSTYSSMKVGAGSLAFSELIGAALFITSVVVGSMSIVHPFKVIKKIFLRDTIYLLISLVILDCIIITKGGVSIFDCLALMALYILYVIVIITWQFIDQRLKEKRKRELKARSQYIDDLEYGPLRNDIAPIGSNKSLNGNNPPEDAYEEEEENENRNPSINDLINETTSINLNKNPFLSSNKDINSTEDPAERHSNLSASSETSRILPRDTSTNYHTYQEVTKPGEIKVGPNLQYNIHEETLRDDVFGGDDEGDEGNEDEIEETRYFVRPSLLDALELNQSINKSQRSPSWVESEEILDDNDDNQSTNYDHLSLHTVAQQDTNNLGLSSTSENRRPFSEPTFNSRKLVAPKIVSNSAPSYKDNPNAMFSDMDPSEIHNEGGEQPQNSNNISDHHQNDANSVDNDSGHATTATNLQKAKKKLKFKKILSYFRFSKIKKSQNLTLVESSSFGGKVILIFFPSLIGFSTKSILDQILTAIILPLLFLLRCTIPVIEYSKLKTLSKSLAELKHMKFMSDLVDNGTTNQDIESRRKYLEALVTMKQTQEEIYNERVIITIQAFIATLIIPTRVFPSSPVTYSVIIPVSFIFAIFLILLIRKSFANRYSETYRQERITHYIRLLQIKGIILILLSIYGFAMSILWISLIAEEVVSLLKFYGTVFDLSDAILGFTIFAIGNSLGDFIANFTIAKMGFPKMALAACFGGPLLNILIGIGGSGLLTIPNMQNTTSVINNVYMIKFGLTLWISNLALVINLMFLLITVPRNGWKMDRSVGYITVSFWVLATITNVAIEIFEK